MTKPHEIVVIHYPIFKPIELEELRVALFRITPNVNVQEKTFGVQNNIEWFYPAAIAIFIASGFINGFLQEIGADSYHSLKNGLKNILKVCKNKPVQWSTLSSLSPDKNKDVEIIVAPSLSLTLEIENLGNRNRTIKFIFPNDVNLEEADKAIDIFRETILKAITQDREKTEKMALGKVILARQTSYAFEPESSEWKELTPDYLYQRHLMKKKKEKKMGKAKKKT